MMAMEKIFKIKGLRWWIAILLMGITTINYLDRTTLSVTAPTLKEDLGINEINYSHIVMAFQFAYLIMMPVMGRIIDWLGLRLGFTLSIILWSLAQMATGLATGWRSFALFRSLLGVTEAGNFPGGAKAVSQWFRPKERTVATGIFNVGAGLGALIAPPLVVFLILMHSWQFAFYATGGFGLLWAILWVSLYREPDKHPWLSESERAYISEGQQELAVAAPPAQRGVLKIVLLQRNFWAFGIARFFSEPAWQFFSYWLPLYLTTEPQTDRILRVASFSGRRPRVPLRRSAFPIFYQKNADISYHSPQVFCHCQRFPNGLCRLCREGPFGRVGNFLYLYRRLCASVHVCDSDDAAGRSLSRQNSGHG
jgi:ACS family hexuronate transporter-like MFS transporter